MCANNLNANSDNQSKKHTEERVFLKKKSEIKPNKVKKKMCLSNKKITRSQNICKVISQDNLLNKSNEKFRKKGCCSSIISCRFCKNCFKTIEESQNHVCTNKSPSNKSVKYKHHLCTTKNIKKHQCEICDKRFNRPLHLTIHKRVHTGEKPLKCLECDKNYYSNKTFARHLKTAMHLKKVSMSDEVIVEKKYTCKKCEAKFFELQSLQRHTQTLHSTEEPLRCDYCTYSTKCKGNLKRHLEVHSQTRRFACDVCGQTFRNFGSLKDHQAFIHSDERNFSCNMCNKSFKVKGDLQRHKKVHSNDRPYKCNCTCSFKRLSHLKRHMLSCKQINVLDKYAQSEGLNKNTSEEDSESCDDPIQFTDVNNKIAKSLLKKSDTFSKNESLLTLNDLFLSSNDETSQTSVLPPLDKTVKNHTVTLNPIVTLADQISAEYFGLSQSAVDLTGDTPSQTTSIPLITSIVTPVMALANSKPSVSTQSTVLTTGVEQPLLNFVENNISLLSVPSVLKPVINFTDSFFSNNASKIELVTSSDHPALNVINNNSPVKVTKNIVMYSNKTIQQYEPQALPHNSFDSRSTSVDNNTSSKTDNSKVLNTVNYNHPSILQHQNISSITVPTSTVKEYHNPRPIYSLLTHNLDFGDKLTENDNDLLYSVSKSKSFVSTELSEVVHESYQADLLSQADDIIPLSSNASSTFYFSGCSSHPVDLSSNTNDKNDNQQLPVLNLANIVGSLNSSMESLVPKYPITVNNLVFSNETVDSTQHANLL